MALRLGDVEKNHLKREERARPASEQTPTLRPWQGFEERDDLRRLKKSELAISRAREISKRNTLMAQELRAGFTPSTVSDGLESALRSREANFVPAAAQWGGRVSIKKGMLSFFKDIFRPTNM